MTRSVAVLSSTEAARHLGISPKALRLYEDRGLVVPRRTEAGWRAYGEAEMARAREVAALRALGLSLTQAARVLKGEVEDLGHALAAHQADLETRAQGLTEAVAKVRALRAGLGQGRAPSNGDIVALMNPSASLTATFDLPWPWGGESFQLTDIRRVNHITGPLGSGKTRFAKAVVANLAGAAFLDLTRLANTAAIFARLAADRKLSVRVEQAANWLMEDGASASDALTVLLAALEDDVPSALVVDTIEEGLDLATQEALIAHLRRRRTTARPIFILTRSSAILDLAAVGADETITYCPPNHTPPYRVEPCRGAPGYESVAACLATPEVRARTQGLVAVRKPEFH